MMIFKISERDGKLGLKLHVPIEKRDPSHVPSWMRKQQQEVKLPPKAPEAKSKYSMGDLRRIGVLMYG